MGKGGHRGGGHHSHSHSSPSSSSSSGGYRHYGTRSTTVIYTSNRTPPTSIYSNPSYASYGYNNGPSPAYQDGYGDSRIVSGNGSSQHGRCCCRTMIICIWASVAFIAGTFLSAQKNIVMDVDETRLYGTGNPFFNSRVTIIDDTASINVFRLDAPLPPLVLSTIPQMISETDDLLPAGDFLDFTYYLNEGSSVVVEFSSDLGVNMLVFQGLDRFAQWVESPSKENEEHAKAVKFSSNNAPSIYKFVAGTPDEYVIVFDNYNDYAGLNLQFVITIVRTVYALEGEGYQAVCHAQSECSIPLYLGDKSQFILSAPKAIVANGDVVYDSSETGDLSFNVHVKGETRWLAVTFIFFLVPVLICLFLMSDADSFREFIAPAFKPPASDAGAYPYVGEGAAGADGSSALLLGHDPAPLAIAGTADDDAYMVHPAAQVTLNTRDRQPPQTPTPIVVACLLSPPASTPVLPQAKAL